MEFVAHSATKRWFRDIVVSEKIDGTNSAVVFEEVNGVWDWDDTPAFTTVQDEDGTFYLVGAQSRKRMINPKDDNFGFAHWVDENKDNLFRFLGPGRHMGEWWGNGIQRGYGLSNGDKRFSLFNTLKWKPEGSYLPKAWSDVPGLGVVPVLYVGQNSNYAICWCAETLRTEGSKASPGYMNPEGVCIYHTQSNQIFKYTLDDNDAHKWEGR